MVSIQKVTIFMIKYSVTELNYSRNLYTDLPNNL